MYLIYTSIHKYIYIYNMHIPIYIYIIIDFYNININAFMYTNKKNNIFLMKNFKERHKNVTS